MKQSWEKYAFDNLQSLNQFSILKNIVLSFREQLIATPFKRKFFQQNAFFSRLNYRQIEKHLKQKLLLNEISFFHSILSASTKLHCSSCNSFLPSLEALQNNILFHNCNSFFVRSKTLSTNELSRSHKEVVITRSQIY